MVCQKINMHICSYNYTLLGPDNCTITDTDLNICAQSTTSV